VQFNIDGGSRDAFDGHRSKSPPLFVRRAGMMEIDGGGD